MRFFRTADDAFYEQARASLDATWGHIPPETCISPSSVAPRDSHGRIVLAVDDKFCAITAAAAMLELAMGSGAVEEIDAATYMDAVDIL